MRRILKVNKPGDFISYLGAPTKHPLVGVIDYAQCSPIPHTLNDYEVYGIFMHSNIPANLVYGCGGYDGESGTLICVAPGQLGGKEDNGELIDIDGWAILFHPELLKGTLLEKDIHKFTFFDYRVNEALFLTGEEQDKIASLMRSIQEEIDMPFDSEQNSIIVGYISALLHLCNRAYSRQFSQIRQSSDDILVRLSALLNQYYDNGEQLKFGVPGVQYFADKLCLSSNYFSDLVKKTTGENAGNFIRNHIIRLAKNRLVSTGNVSQVAYDMGFEYPQHFSRMFKKHTGISPSQYLTSLNKR
ncbi:MAG: helix-turn-helix domain-containing protein [Clostridiales bacterium]|nr:helix-turn-helix domain-containing protein [Clostridiales bacterium]